MKVFTLNTRFLLVFILLSLESRSHSTTYDFKNISVENGLAHSVVNDIFQDKRGFVWFATGNGLCKYDGYSFTTFKTNPSNPSHSVIGNRFTTLDEDDEGNLWIGTSSEGLNIYYRKTNQFSYWTKISKDSVNKLSNYILKVKKAPNGEIWIGTDEGFAIINPKTFKIKNHPIKDKFGKPVSTYFFYFDTLNAAWIGTSNGLYQYNSKDSSLVTLFEYSVLKNINENYFFSFFPINDDKAIIVLDRFLFSFDTKRNQLSKKPLLELQTIITASEKMKDGRIWLGNNKGQIIIYNPKRNKIEYSNTLTQFHNSFLGGRVYKIYQTHNLFWISMGRRGVFIICSIENKSKFRHLNFLKDIEKQKDLNQVWTVIEDKNGNIVIGSILNSIAYVANGKLKFDYFDKNCHGGNFVGALIYDNDGNLWVGSFENGISVYKTPHNKVLDINKCPQFQLSPNSPQNLKIQSWSIRVLLNDKQNKRVWIGGIDGGLDYYDLILKKTFHVQNSNNSIWTLKKSRDGKKLWIGTNNNGLELLDIESGVIQKSVLDISNETKYYLKSIICIYLDRQDFLWLGTEGGGLIKYNPKTRQIVKKYNESNGLYNNTVYSVNEDKRGFFWVNTNKSISRFDPKTEQFLNFTKNDGVINLEFNPGASFVASNGNYYYGGIDGVTYFNPDSLVLNREHPPLIFTDFKIFNKSIMSGQPYDDNEIILKENINEVKEITLNFSQNFFSLEFTSIEFISPYDIQYYYILEGFNKNWIETDAYNRFATFTNIPSGEYILKVKSKNEDGFLNENAISIKIIINPPYWETWWFRTLVSLLILFIIALVYKLRQTWIRKTENLILKLVNERTSLIEHEKNQLKSEIQFKDQWYNNLRKNIKQKKESISDKSVDEKLLDIFSDSVIKHLSNPDLDVEMLAKEVGMSRTLLYSKMKSLTGISVGDFIQGIRMSQAAILLTSNNHSISEVSELVGFSDPAYFSKSFKKHFGLTPTDFTQMNSKNT